MYSQWQCGTFTVLVALSSAPTNLNAIFFFLCFIKWLNLRCQGKRNLLEPLQHVKPMINSNQMRQEWSFPCTLWFIPKFCGNFFFLFHLRYSLLKCSRSHLPQVQKPKGPQTNWSEHAEALNSSLSASKFLSSNFLYALESQKPRRNRDMAARYYGCMFILLRTLISFYLLSLFLDCLLIWPSTICCLDS